MWVVCRYRNFCKQQQLPFISPNSEELIQKQPTKHIYTNTIITKGWMLERGERGEGGEGREREVVRGERGKLRYTNAKSFFAILSYLL